MRDQAHCYVYAITYEEAETDEPCPMKVGISANPWSRIREIQTGCPHPLWIAGTVRMPSRDAALFVESQFHSRNGHVRLNGEWFEISVWSALLCIITVLKEWTSSRGIPGHHFREWFLERLT
jgi:hypothetical protein